MMASKPWRILVGDDEPNVREALADLLRLLGHDVETAHDGKSTVKLFQTGTFDMVFTDLGMPDMTGWEVTEAIREIDAEVPIVLATGWGSEIDEAAAQNRGVTRVLAKPFTVQKISSLVAELQGRRQAA
jgi:CheY-like chemotaxis protein